MNDQLNKDLRANVNRELSARVRDHLTKQRARSVDSGGGCAYRGDGGMMCAVGCLIPDDKYHKNMEDEMSHSPMMRGVLEAEHGGYVNHQMLREWQKYHDGERYTGWLAEADMSPAEFHEQMMRRYGYE
jgi:hypothetical protein